MLEQTKHNSQASTDSQAYLRDPSDFQSMTQFLHNTTQQPLYSVVAFQQKCHELLPDYYPPMDQQSEPLHMQPEQTGWMMLVKYGDSWAEVEFTHMLSLAELMTMLQAECGFGDHEKLRLHYATTIENIPGEQWVIVNTDAKLHKMLQKPNFTSILWALRPVSTTSSSTPDSPSHIGQARAVRSSSMISAWRRTYLHWQGPILICAHIFLAVAGRAGGGDAKTGACSALTCSTLCKTLRYKSLLPNICLFAPSFANRIRLM